jgi:histidinol-phosphatase (PHP family)
VIDYHLHLWPHSESSVWFQLDQIAQYCEHARAHGVTELALTEHAHRFVEVRDVVGDFWARSGHEPTAAAMGRYWDFHARNSLERYVELALAAKAAGLPVRVGLEVDYCVDQMDALSALYRQFPFDVLIGSVHWLGTWQFDDLAEPAQAAQWSTRDVESCWSDYARAIGELAATKSVDVLAHPDVIKLNGNLPASPAVFWDAMSDAAANAGVSVECSSAGWNKPAGEQYPAAGFLDQLVQKGVTFTTASDAHRLDRVAERTEDLAQLLEARGIHELAAYDNRVRRLVPLRAPA